MMTREEYEFAVETDMRATRADGLSPVRPVVYDTPYGLLEAEMQYTLIDKRQIVSMKWLPHELRRFPLRASRLHLPGVITTSPMVEYMHELLVGMSVSVDVSTCEEDAGNRYFGKIDEAMEAPGEKHGVMLLVQNPEPNFNVKEKKK